MTRLTRLKRIAHLHTETMDDAPRPLISLENLHSGTGKLISEAALSDLVPPKVDTADVAPGDVLFGKLRPYLAKTWVADRPARASTELLCLRPSINIDSRWLGYVATSGPFVDWAVATSDGTKMPRTSWERLGNFRLEVPPFNKQRAIADYLGRETGRIDALVAAKRQMIHLLEERRTVELDSIWESLERRAPLKRMIVSEKDALIAGPFGSDLAGSDVRAEGPCVIYDQEVVLNETFANPRSFVDGEKAIELRRFTVRPGDILVTGRGTIGRAALVPDRVASGIMHPCLLRVRVNRRRLIPDFLVAYLRWSTQAENEFRLGSTATTIEVIYSSTLRGLLIPDISLDKQATLLVTISKVASETDAAMGSLRTQISLLAERRQALITAAVTGQLDIPDAA